MSGTGTTRRIDSVYSEVLSKAAGLSGTRETCYMLAFVMNLPETVQTCVQDLNTTLSLDVGGCVDYLAALGLLNIETNAGDNIFKGSAIDLDFQEYLRDARAPRDFRIRPRKIAKLIKLCLRYICGCRPTTQQDFSALYLAIKFFEVNQSKVRCGVKFAKIMNDFSIFNYCKVDSKERKKLCAAINQSLVPCWLHWLKCAGMGEEFLKHRKRLDEEYQTLLGNYYRDRRLSLALTFILHFAMTDENYDDRFLPFQMKGLLSPEWALSNIEDCEDPLGILNVVTELEYGINQHHEQLALYLRNPKRSGRFSLQEAGGLLHANAVLACLAFLSRVKVEEKEVVAVPESSTGIWVAEYDIGANDGMVVDEDGKKVEEDFKDVLEKYYGEEKRFIVFPNMCAWRWDWEKFRKEKELTHKGKYLLALGLVRYFLYRAGRSEELVQKCIAKALPEDTTLYPVHRAAVIKAMDTYVRICNAPGAAATASAPGANRKCPYDLRPLKTRVYTWKEEFLLHERPGTTVESLLAMFS